MRLYHSPSSVELGKRCPRAWYYTYVEGRRRVEVPWSESLQGRDRSLALGTALHATLEAHFTPGGEPNWLWFPGEVAASGVGLLPKPHRDVAVEVGIGSRGTGVSIGPGHDGHERFTVTIGGVPWLGYRDLVLDHGAGDEPSLYDYKSTKSIDDYAKSVAELLQDLQANLYAYDTMSELGVDTLLCRWVYFETARRRKAEPRDFIVHKAEAQAVIECAAETAKALDQIESIEQAPMNVNACPEFGGCEFHKNRGGPCSANVPVGALIQARIKKDGKIMPLNKNANPTSAALAAKFSNQATGAVLPVVETTAAEAPPVETRTAEPAPVETVVAAKPRRKPATGGSYAAVAQELTESEAALAEANARHDAAKDAMRKALG